MKKQNPRARWSSAHLVSLFVLAMSLVTIRCGGEEEKGITIGSEQFAATTWFGNLTQSQRNSYILNRAWQDNGNYVGLNCKEWARQVVKDASSQQADLPSTCSYPNNWAWCGTFVDVASIWYMQAGYIVQMQLSDGGPHTAIVASVNYGTNQLQLIESNWSPPYGLRVSNRWLTIDGFNASYPNHSFYVVTGH